MLKTLRTFTWLTLAAGVAACVPPLSMRDAKPGDRVVCESTPNRAYLSGWNYFLSSCHEASPASPDTLPVRRRARRDRSSESVDAPLRP